MLRIDINGTEIPGERPIDRDKPAVWRPRDGFAFTTTHNSYGFVNRVKKHGGQAGNIAIRILGQQWVDFTLEESIRLGGERLEQAVEYLRSFVAEGEVTLEAKLLAFPTGQQLLDYVEEVKVALVREEVVQ